MFNTSDVTTIPQVWTLCECPRIILLSTYRLMPFWIADKEVEGYYDQGLKVPDDIVMLWSDDKYASLYSVSIAFPHFSKQLRKRASLPDHRGAQEERWFWCLLPRMWAQQSLLGTLLMLFCFNRSTTSVFPGATSGLR